MLRIAKAVTLYCFLLAELIFAQQKTIKGSIKDTSGPLPGVTVLIKNTTKGTESDFDGNYVIKANENDVLVFSFIGMASIERKVGKQSIINVVFEEAPNMLNEVEVVATGYRKIDRKLFAGAATKLKMEDIKLASESDISKSLEGQVAGVSVQNVSSTFGAAPTIRVRGSSSINGNQAPLWVIDGVVLEDAVNVSNEDINSGNLNAIVSSGVAGLNMEDVEEFQILKDASATALYGARAMNGVIVINTKKGEKGNLNINYSSSMIIRPRPSYADFNILNSKDQMSVNRELYEKGWINIANTQGAATHGPYGKLFDEIAKNNIQWGTNDSQINSFLRKYETANTNWFKELFNTGIQSNHSLNVSGGGQKATYYASVSFLKDGGVTIADHVDRYTTLLKGTFFVSDKLNITTQANISYRHQGLSGVSDSGNGVTNQNDVGGVDRYTGRVNRDFDNNPFMYALHTSRNIRARDERGNFEYFRKNFTDFNMVEELSLNKTQLTAKDMSFLTNINYELKDNVIFNARLSARFVNNKIERLTHEKSNEARSYRAGTGPLDSELIRERNYFLFEMPDEVTGIRYSRLPEGGIYGTRNQQMKNYFINSNISWDPRYGDDHKFTFFLGSEMRIINRSIDWNSGFGHLYDFGNVSKPSEKNIIYLASIGRSYFGREETFDRFFAGLFNYGYTFKNKYTLNGAVRYEASNRLGKSTAARWFPTWSISGKWNVSKENFMQGVSWVNNLALRTSYGLNGSLGNAVNASLIAKSRNSSRPIHPDASELEIYIEQLGNNDLTWEKQYEFNIGLDYGLFNNSIRGDFNYYRRNGFDLVGGYMSSGVGGERVKWGNVLDLKGEGFEVSLSATPIKTDDFKWDIAANFSQHINTVKNLQSQYWLGRASSQLGIPVENGPVRGFYSARFAGLDHEGIPEFFDRNNNKVKFIALQSNDYSDFVFSGNLEPTQIGGLTNTISYKGIALSALISGQFGHKKRVYNTFSYRYQDHQALSSHLINRWRVQGDEAITNIPVVLDADRLNSDDRNNIATAYNLYNMSDFWVADASFIRLKNISLSYALSRSLLKKLRLSNVRVGLQGSNLALLWLADPEKLNGEDPEFVSSGGSIMPIIKQYTVTLNVGF